MFVFTLSDILSLIILTLIALYIIGGIIWIYISDLISKFKKRNKNKEG